MKSLINVFGILFVIFILAGIWSPVYKIELCITAVLFMFFCKAAIEV